MKRRNPWEMGIPLSHLPAPILVLKCSESLCSCIRRLNYVLASTVGVKTSKGEITKNTQDLDAAEKALEEGLALVRSAKGHKCAAVEGFDPLINLTPGSKLDPGV